MPVETRYYDTEGDGYWFRLQPVDNEDPSEGAVVYLTHSVSRNAAVYLSADDVEQLIEELKQYTKKPESKSTPYRSPYIGGPAYPTPVTYNVDNKKSVSSDPFPG